MTLPAVVAVGSNLGDSVARVRSACARLAGRAASGFLVSSLWESTPVDCPPGSPPFVNAVVLFEPHLDETPETLLDLLQAWEREAGRVRTGTPNEPRVLDLDLVGFGRHLRNTARLTLPHPRAHRRRFVLQPLAEIAPDLVLPGWDDPVGSLLAALESGEALHRLGNV